MGREPVGGRQVDTEAANWMKAFMDLHPPTFKGQLEVDPSIAKNVVSLLAPLPVSDRFWASDTLLFEAQARLQDPVYGCVSHILALQQQVSDLQAYRAYLQDSLFAYCSSHPQLAPQPDQYPSWNSDLPIIQEDVAHPSFSEATLPPYRSETSSSQMPLPDDIDELGPVVFGNHRHP
ncbi:LOB domain-containing protein 18-like [Diospyros lotus]|uniref:LOB domain-containing protein 18-like n=1 Tax=Diospyros lotus TaxID=55363 RepID=UPI00224E188A|nr:LOB domain-containing protein 18-like [Diospyros lotus]